MIDLHILTLSDSRADWRDRCVASVLDAAARAGYPVHVHVVPGIDGHLGLARARGYAVGSAPWKCYVDDDDYVLPGAFKALAPHLSSDVAAIFPRERIEQNGRFHKHTQGRHHLWPVRAELALGFDHEAWPSMPDEMLRRTAAADPRGVLDVDDVVYVHRVYVEQRCRPLRRANRPEVLRAMGAMV